MNRQARPEELTKISAGTFTGNRALDIEEALIFEVGRPEVTGVDLDTPADFSPRLGSFERKSAIGLPGLSDIHPLQPLSTVPGALALLAELGRWLRELTGTAAVALSPKAGAHGELCGLMAIKAALAARSDARSIVLVPESAHGTNPASAALLGYRVEAVPARSDGTVDPVEVEKHVSAEVAAL